jgi:molybdate transport system substrate-binding protein
MKRRISVGIIAALVALVMAAPAFGASQTAATAAAKGPKINVFAAASLSHVFPAMVAPFKKLHPAWKNTRFVFNFQGTDTLVAQIEQGAPCNIFAGASTKYGNQLFTAGWIYTPQNFCRNKLTVILPAKNSAGLKSLSDLANTNPRPEIAIGDPAVPIGTYTRTVLTNLNALYPQFTAPNTYSALVLSNVVSEEVNVSAVVALVELNEVDAGFVYVSDAKYAGKAVKSIAIPEAYQSNPLPTYPIATTVASKQAPAPTKLQGKIARSFIKYVMGKTGQKQLKAYGFLAPLPAS